MQKNPNQDIIRYSLFWGQRLTKWTAQTARNPLKRRIARTRINYCSLPRLCRKNAILTQGRVLPRRFGFSPPQGAKRAEPSGSALFDAGW